MSNEEYQQQQFWNMKSNFKPEEILGFIEIDGRRVTVLKPGVKRKRFNDDIDPDSLEKHLNMELINYERYTEFYKNIMGVDNFETES